MNAPPRTFRVKSFGCQMNVYDGERMAELLGARGLRAADEGEDADLVVLNTCHIREKAAEKVYSDIGRLVKAGDEAGRKPMIAVAGCVAQAEGEEIMARAPAVGLVVGPQAYHRLPEMIERVARGERAADTDMPADAKFAALPARRRAGPSAFLTIQEGCDKFCTYCVVPYTRGAEISRPFNDLLREAEALAEAGAREITDRLDAVGNTTKALTKGYAIASASLAAFLLFSAYIDKVNLIEARRIAANVPGAALLESVNLANVNVFIAALIGAMLVYFFSSLAIRAVGKTAQSIIVEVRRQFREMPGIMDYTQRPDYARVVDITTKAALREMIAPGMVAVATPIIVGLLLGAEAVAGMLMVGTIAGVMLATVLNNGGGAWDNAKKYIESGNLKDAQGNVLGKGSDAHAAAVVGDTVGDPFKDTAGPSLHVLVKLLATITLVLAPLFIR